MSKEDRLQRTLELSRQGYSHYGIAKRLGVTESTAKSYLDEVAERHGDDILVDF